MGAEGVSPRTNVVISIIILLACGLAWLATDTLPRGLTVDPIGPAYFPRFIILSITVLSVLLLITSLLGLRRRAAAEPEREPRTIQETPPSTEAAEEEEELPPISYPRMLAVLALSIGSVLLMTTLGYFIATMLYVALLLPLLRVRKPLPIIGCALGVPLVLQSLFNKLLGVPLPGGLLDKLPFTIPF